MLRICLLQTETKLIKLKNQAVRQSVRKVLLEEELIEDGERWLTRLQAQCQPEPEEREHRRKSESEFS